MKKMQILFVVIAFLAPSRSQSAVTVGNFAAGEFTSGGVEGTAPVGANVDVQYRTLAGVKTLSAPVDPTGRFRQTLPAAIVPQTVIVTSPLCPPGTPPASVLYVFQRFEPGRNTVVTAGTFLPGSSVNAGGAEFAVSGGFVARDTDVDYDPASPTYGNLSGVLLASQFDLTGTGPAGQISLRLFADEPYTVNLLPVWSADDPNGVSIPISASLSGLATFNGMETPFSGTVQGSVAFFTDATELLRLNLNFSSPFGPITGLIEARNIETLHPVPEPSSVLLLVVSLLGIVSAQWHTRREMPVV